MRRLELSKALVQGGSKGIIRTGIFLSEDFGKASCAVPFIYSVAMTYGCFFTSEEYAYCGHDMQFIYPKEDKLAKARKAISQGV